MIVRSKRKDTPETNLPQDRPDVSLYRFALQINRKLAGRRE